MKVKAQKDFTPEDKAKILDLYDKGYSYSTISLILRFNSSGVNHWIRAVRGPRSREETKRVRAMNPEFHLQHRENIKRDG